MALKRSTSALIDAVKLKRRARSNDTKLTPAQRKTLANYYKTKRKELGRKRTVKSLTDNAHYDRRKVRFAQSGIHGYSWHKGMRM